MKKIDFLFIYEVKLREIESIILLKYELEKQGYSVQMINTWSYLTTKPPKYKAKVVVTSALYDDATYKFFTCFTNYMTKIINLQWEQVTDVAKLNHQETQEKITGYPKNAVHICWGQHTKNNLLNKCKIDEIKLPITGAINLDFSKKEFNKYYNSKQQIFDKYEISSDKKVCLFISSFAFVNAPKNYTDIASNYTDVTDVESNISSSIKSQKEIIKWIKSILEKRNDVIFIYRPHPAEMKNADLLRIQDKYDNFYVITEYSIGQWTLICDVVYTWVSTSIVDVYLRNKPCHILRPYPVADSINPAVYIDSKNITEYSKFEKSIDLIDNEFPISKDVISNFYYFDPEEASYKKVCSKLIEVINNDYYMMEKPKGSQKNSIIEKLGLIIYRSNYFPIVAKILNNKKIKSKIKSKRIRNILNIDFNLIDTMKKSNFTSNKEIQIIQNRIKNALESKSE